MQKPYKKFFTPLFIDLINQKTIKLSDDEKEEPLKPGIFNDCENYGFILIASKDGKQYKQEFGTEERIEAVGIRGDKLTIFEEGKRNPWLFDLNGELNEEAKFDFRYRCDGEYYLEKYGSPLERQSVEKTL